MSKIWITKTELRQMIREACEMCEAGTCDACGESSDACKCVKESRGSRRAATWKAKRKGKESPARGSKEKHGTRGQDGKTKPEKDHERKQKEQLKDE